MTDYQCYIFYTFFLSNLQQYTPEFFSTNKHKKNFAKSFRALSKVFFLIIFLRFYFLYNSKYSRTISKSSKWCLTPLISW